MKKFWILKGIKMGLLFILAIIAFGFVVMYLWNWLIPALFNGPMVNFYQALGILVLSKILFGGFKKGGSCCNCNNGGYKGGWKGHLRDKIESKMSSMTPEEKEKFKKRFGNRCNMWQEDSSEESKSE